MRHFLALALLAAALSACQSAPIEPAVVQPVTPPPPAPPPSGSADLDSSVIVTPPDKKVPSKYAAFSGIWTGSWDGVQHAKLAVRSVASNGRVTVTYAWGSLGDLKPGIVDGQGKISAGGKMKLDRFASGVDASFVMQGDGTLAGTYLLAGAGPEHTAIFRKQ
jgi:hypothetical protein